MTAQRQLRARASPQPRLLPDPLSGTKVVESLTERGSQRRNPDRPPSGTNPVRPLTTESPLTPEQQAHNLCVLQHAVFHEPDLSSQWLATGVWVAYPVLALVWMRSVAQWRRLRWLAAGGSSSQWSDDRPFAAS
jgi:hypothetical protein